MLGVGLPEFAVIAVIAIFVFGPDKLPDLARQAGRMARQVKRMANNARDELREEPAPSTPTSSCATSTPARSSAATSPR